MRMKLVTAGLVLGLLALPGASAAAETEADTAIAAETEADTAVTAETEADTASAEELKKAVHVCVHFGIRGCGRNVLCGGIPYGIRFLGGSD